MIDQQITDGISNRIRYADKMHPPMADNYIALGALALEYDEVKEAMQARDVEQTYEELLDVATVAIRRAQAIRVEMDENPKAQKLNGHKNGAGG